MEFQGVKVLEGFSDVDTVKRVAVDKGEGGCRHGGIKANG